MLSILSGFMSANFFYLIMLQFCSILIKDFDGLEYNWLNSFALQALNKDTVMSLEIFVNLCFVAFCLFGVYAAVKGNDYYGYRSSCFTFYAMT